MLAKEQDFRGPSINLFIYELDQCRRRRRNGLRQILLPIASELDAACGTDAVCTEWTRACAPCRGRYGFDAEADL